MRKVLSLFAALCVVAAWSTAGAQTDKIAQSKQLKEQADQLMKGGNRGAAIVTYKSAIGTFPGNWEAHDALGTAYFKEKMYLDAAMEFGEALALNPGYQAGHYNMAYAYRKAGRYNEAIKFYEKYIKMKPDDTDAYYGLAESYKAVGEKDKAIENYQIYIQKEQRPSEQKWIDKAKASIAELQGGQQPAPVMAPVVAAVPAPAPGAQPVPGYGAPPAAPQPYAQPAPQAYQKPAPQAYPSPPPQPAPQPYAQPGPQPAAAVAAVPAPAPAGDPLVAEGDGHFKAGSYHNAIASYKDAIMRNPNSVEARYKLGIAYAVTKRYDAAIGEWRNVLAIDPNNQGARDNIAKAEAKMRQDAAQAPVAQPVPQPAPPVAALPVQPQPPPAANLNDLYQAALAANGKGDYNAALYYCNEILKQRQDFAKAHIVKGFAFMGMGQSEQSLKAFNDAMVFDPQLAAPLFGMAEAYWLMANREKALHYYKLFTKSAGPDKEAWMIGRADQKIKMIEGGR